MAFADAPINTLVSCVVGPLLTFHCHLAKLRRHEFNLEFQFELEKDKYSCILEGALRYLDFTMRNSTAVWIIIIEL